MSVATAVLLALAAGVLNGSFAAPTKYATRWKWENIWAVWALVAFLLFPWILAFATVPHLMAVYHETNARTMSLLIAFGAGYGIAAVCFGLGVAAIGIALNFAIALGLSTAVGSLVPLISVDRGAELNARVGVVLLGIALTLAGIVVCAAAGMAKEKAATRAREATSDVKRARYGVGLTFAVIAGVGSPLLNFGVAFGTPILTSAAAQGASATAQANALWPPILTATLIPYFAYCAYLWRKNRSFALFAARGTGVYWVFGAIMGSLWMGSIAIYGIASAAMAAMGPVLGWPLFMSSIILTSNVWGFATGEWRGAGKRPLLILSTGMLLLILGFCTLAYASRGR